MRDYLRFLIVFSFLLPLGSCCPTCETCWAYLFPRGAYQPDRVGTSDTSGVVDGELIVGTTTVEFTLFMDDGSAVRATYRIADEQEEVGSYPG